MFLKKLQKEKFFFTHINIKQLIQTLKARHQEKKFNFEIPKLADFLISYLNAGVHPIQAIEYASQKNSFSRNLRFSLFKVTALCSRGCSFIDAIDIVLKDSMCMRSRKYLSLLLMSLKIAFLEGASSVRILEKIRDKVNDELQFQKKLRVITAQMRLQANVILFSPISLSLIIFLIAPNHILVFFESFFGNCLLIAMIVFNLFCYFMLKNIMNIK